MRLPLALWLASLVALVVAVVVAEFGAPAWVFVLLLAWLATAGLPVTVAVVLVASVWPGPSLGAFAATAAALAFFFQLGAVWAVRRVWRRFGRRGAAA